MRRINNLNTSNIRKSRFPIIFLEILIIFFAVTIFLTIKTSLDGLKLSELEFREISLTKEKQENYIKYATLSSVTSILDNAGNIGFAKPQTIVYLSKELPIAKLP